MSISENQVAHAVAARKGLGLRITVLGMLALVAAAAAMGVYRKVSEAVDERPSLLAKYEKTAPATDGVIGPKEYGPAVSIQWSHILRQWQTVLRGRDSMRTQLTLAVLGLLASVALLGGPTLEAAAQEKQLVPGARVEAPLQLADRMVHRRAVEAAIWGMPAVNFDLMNQAMLRAKGAPNQIVYWSRPLDWKNQTLTPNPDTIYFMPFFNTKDVGPMVLEIPLLRAGNSALRQDMEIAGRREDELMLGATIMRTLNMWALVVAVVAPDGDNAPYDTKPTAANAVPVTAVNFERAETDLYFGIVVKDGGFGKFHHNREPTPIDKQTVIRMNRDTLYSAAVFDLDAGPVTITLPHSGKRFMSMQVIDQDQYAPAVVYGAGNYTYTREQIGTRYVLTAVRTLIDPASAKDLEEVHKLQDAIQVEQKSTGKFEVPKWDFASQKKVCDALLVLGSTLPDSKRMFGRKDQVDPVRHLIGTAMAWGGNPEKDAIYLNVTPSQNDGKTVYRLTVKDVPVDAFWSISVYNAQGYFQENKENAYTLNNLTAQKGEDGSITIQFGGCDGKTPNCLPTMQGWNYIVRLYRPRAEVLDDTWTFPQAQPLR